MQTSGQKLRLYRIRWHPNLKLRLLIGILGASARTARTYIALQIRKDKWDSLGAGINSREPASIRRRKILQFEDPTHHSSRDRLSKGWQYHYV
jgi:hypothetical protein